MKRARTVWAFAAVVLAAFVVTQSAAAHLPGRVFCSARQPAKVELTCGMRAYYHGLGASTSLRAQLVQARRVQDAQVVASVRHSLHDHLWLMKAGQHWIAEARQRLTPTLASWGVPDSFVSNATCVHGNEGAWPDDTGNGYGGGMQFKVGTWNRAAGISYGRVPYASSTGDIGRQPPMVQIYAAYLIVVKQDGGSWREWRNTGNACGLYTG